MALNLPTTNWENTTINERVRYILTSLFNGNCTLMAKSSFISRSSINNIIGENETMPGYDIIRRLLEMRGGAINPNWLILGKGEMLKNDAELVATDLVPDLPVEAAAGFSAELQEGITPSMCNMLPRIPRLPDYDLTISVRGDSMEPTYCSGDRLAIRRCYDFVEWGAPHVLDTSEGVYIKRIKQTNDAVTCISDNPDYPPFDIPKGSVRAIYKVIALLRIC